MIKSPCAIGRKMMFMARFIPKEKLSKKAQKELNRQRRVIWEFSPVSEKPQNRRVMGQGLSRIKEKSLKQQET